MLTPDDMTAPPPFPEPLEAMRERWPGWLKAEFSKMAPASVWIGGARDLITATVHHADGTATRFGHNRLARPVKVGQSGSWKDTVTARVDQVPFWWQGLLVRLWVRSEPHAQLLVGAVVEHLSEIGDGAAGLRKDFVDIGPDVDVERLRFDLRAMADRMNMDSWDDDDLVHYLAQLHHRRLNEAITSKRGRGR